MIIELPEIWIILIDIVTWLIIHMSVAYLATILPEKYVRTNLFLFREGKWETGGLIYEKIFKIKKWKELLPDGSTLFNRGFRKKRLKSRDNLYLNRFLLETCRAEAAHWTVIFCSPVFFLWNYTWAGYIMILYAILANFPCIITQRYNRIRIKNLKIQ